MILARLALGMGLTCAALAAFPAKADVMEIDADGARWVAGGSTAPPAASIPHADFEPMGEVPADIYVPDMAIGDPNAPGALARDCMQRPLWHRFAKRQRNQPLWITEGLWIPGVSGEHAGRAPKNPRSSSPWISTMRTRWNRIRRTNRSLSIPGTKKTTNPKRSLPRSW